MYTKSKTLLLSVIIMSVFCINMVCWGRGLIVFSLGGDAYMMRPNDTEPTLIGRFGWSAPSPDGRFMADIASGPDHRDTLYIRHLYTGKKIRSLKLKVKSMTDISWSPNGRWIAYAGNALGPIKGHQMDTDLFLISPDGRRHRQLPDQVGKRPIDYVWSADSRSVFYHIWPTGRPAEIWQLNINGKQNPKKYNPYHKGITYTGCDQRYSFSPNGKEIAYISATQGVYVANIDGTNRRRVFDNDRFKLLYDVDWAPNGQHLVFSASKKFLEDYGLYIFSFASKKVRPLISSQDSWPRRPHWVEDSLAVHPSNKMAISWGEIKNLKAR